MWSKGVFKYKIVEVVGYVLVKESKWFCIVNL